MTRQHAHEFLFGQIKTWEGKEVENFLTALELLGLIKFDEDCETLTIKSHANNPLNSVQVMRYRAIEALEQIGYKVIKA